MIAYSELSADDLLTLQSDLDQQHSKLAAQNLNLDMTRGKPSPEQLDLSNSMLNLDHFKDVAGTDCRNYGGMDGLPELKTLFAEILETNSENIIIGGNASLTLMFDALARASLFGVSNAESPWHGSPVKMLCPSPGYDRHFTVSQTLGMESIYVKMTDAGPDMDQVENLVSQDSSIKSIWCVPKYSNPTGISYSDKTVERLANMKTAAADFRIMWDNAYAEHRFSGELTNVKEIISSCAEAGNHDRPYVFASTSKISFAGSGVAAFASSLSNIAYAKQHVGAQTIGPDKLNQLRHIKLFPNLASLRAHMNNHASILAPKFAMVEQILDKSLAGTQTANWTKPGGGYFISVDLNQASAKRVIAICDELGVKLTAAGATFPYGIDPNDNNIRIAPSFPTMDEIEQAMGVFVLAVKLATLESLAG